MGNIFQNANSSAVARKELVAYINVGTAEAPSWAAVGWQCEDSSLAVEMDTDTKKDILGNVFTNTSTPELSQSFDPLPIYSGNDAAKLAIQQKIHNIWMTQDFTQFSNFDALIVYLYAGNGNPGAEDCQYDAHRFPESTVELGDFGGSGEDNLSQAFTIHYGGAVSIGTVTIANGVVTFAAANA